MTSVNDIPVAYTPAGGYTEWPAPVLAGCTDPLPDGAPDLRGIWQVADVRVARELVDDHGMIGAVFRNEQAGDRVAITGGGVIHDMRCDGTLEHGVHDVAGTDFPIQIAMWKSGLALACGNAMIFKPAEVTPISAGFLAEIYTESGVPPGVFNVV